MEILHDLPRITGTEVNYCIVCKRKLWLFARQITMEHNSQKVEIGRAIHDNSFEREKKELLIDDTIAIDFSGGQFTIHETKSTNSMNEASRYQLLYYLYYLEKKGIEGAKGVVHYYKNRSVEEMVLTDEARNILERILCEINQTKEAKNPPAALNSNICKKCSYFELCYS